MKPNEPKLVGLLCNCFARMCEADESMNEF